LALSFASHCSQYLGSWIALHKGWEPASNLHVAYVRQGFGPDSCTSDVSTHIKSDSPAPSPLLKVYAKRNSFNRRNWRKAHLKTPGEAVS